MAYSKIPDKDAVLLVRALGLLVHQAGIYGPKHNVTQSAARSVFVELEQALKTFGPIEVAVKDNRILLNGSVEGMDAGADKNLLDRMLMHKIGGVVFFTPPEYAEFLRCVELFGTPPAQVAAEGGFDAVLKQAGLRSVKVVTVAYQRVAADNPEPPPLPDEEHNMPAEQKRSAGLDGGVLDLAAAWELNFRSGAEGLQPQPAPSTAAARKERSLALAALLRDTAALLEREESLSEAEQQLKVMEALARIREALIASTAESERQIAALADQVDEDRQKIDLIESAAQRRGVGLKITRGELVERYAELNQEIIQPLTVSTGVIDLLHSGKGGPLTETQRDMLKLASDSVERVNQLVAYMGRIAGLPDSYTPDMGLIADSYR